MIPRQGEIWWVEAEDKRRPVLLVTRDEVIPVLNRVVVAPATCVADPTESSHRRPQPTGRRVLCDYPRDQLNRIGSTHACTSTLCQHVGAEQGHAGRRQAWQRGGRVMIGRKQRDRAAAKVFAALDRAEPVLVERLTAYGITGVEFVVGFVHPYSVWVWLVTATDAQRDALGDAQPLHSEVGAILAEAGLPKRHASFNGTTTQSQETVDRDYEGNWFYALR